MNVPSNTPPSAPSPNTPPSLVVECGALLNALKHVSGVIEPSQVMQILAFVKCHAEHQRLVLTGTDAEVEMMASAPLAQPLAAPFDVAVPCRKLLDICRACPKDAMVEWTLEGAWLHVRCGNAQFTLATLDASAFPDMVLPTEGVQTVELAENTLLQLLRQVACCMAQNDVRYFLNAVCLRYDSGTLKAVTTDGHRMALATVEGALELITQQPWLLPRKAVLELVRLLSDTDQALTLTLTPHHVRVATQRVVMTANLLDGQFPDCEPLLPHPDACTHVPLDRDAFKQMLARASVLAHEKFRAVRLSFEAGRLAVQAHNAEHEQTNDAMEAPYEGEPFDIAFNIQYLLDVLQVTSGDTFPVYFKQDRSHLMVADEVGAVSVRYLVMPLTL